MNNETKKRIELLEEYIRNSSEKTTADSINIHSFYSYRHANRLFKSLKGESIQSYSNKIRISIAAEYLKYSSKKIIDIAIDSGYESTAAFSKAFKKQYGQSPTSFRKTNQFHLLNKNLPNYEIVSYDNMEIQTYKMSMNSDISLVDFYQKIRATLKDMKVNTPEWMLLWNEDPKLSKIAEIHYSLGFQSNMISEVNDDYKSIMLKGKYAVFNASELKEYAYHTWHEITYSVLEMNGKELREAPYVEWFLDVSLNTPNTFSPYKIAIPIE